MKSHEKNHYLLTLVLVSALMCLSLPVAAESGTAPVAIKLYFHQDHSDFSHSYRNNAELLDEFVQLTGIADNVNGPRIRVSSSASAEGPHLHNVDLSNRRAATISELLVSKYGISRDRIEVSGQETDWQDLLYQVNAAKGLSDGEKVQVAEIIANVREWTYDSKGNIIDSRSKHLKNINNGRTWNWMLENIFYEQRYGIVSIVNPDGSSWQRSGDKGLVIDNLDAASLAALQDMMHRMDSLTRVADELAKRVDSLSSGAVASGLAGAGDTLYIREDHYYYNGDTIHPYSPVMFETLGNDGVMSTSGEPKSYKIKTKKGLNYHFAVKTNLLFDLTTALNVELEFPIKNKLSLMLEHNFPWWLPVFGERHYAMELLRTGIEARYWFGDRKKAPLLTGWFVGAYGSADYYDFEWQNRGIQGETFFDFGVSGGYSFKIAENWRIETSLGLGYFKSNYTEYDHRLDVGLLVYQKDDSFSWIGPTKLKCSISWIIPNYPTEKSKARKAVGIQKKHDKKTGK